jgi:hypothetical protein
VNKNEVVTSKQFGSTCLATIEDLGAHEYFRFLQDLNGVLEAFAIVTLVTENKDDSEHLEVVDAVIAFCRI